jgi:hypothetical protein
MAAELSIKQWQVSNFIKDVVHPSGYLDAHEYTKLSTWLAKWKHLACKWGGPETKKLWGAINMQEKPELVAALLEKEILPSLPDEFHERARKCIGYVFDQVEFTDEQQLAHARDNLIAYFKTKLPENGFPDGVNEEERVYDWLEIWLMFGGKSEDIDEQIVCSEDLWDDKLAVEAFFDYCIKPHLKDAPEETLANALNCLYFVYDHIQDKEADENMCTLYHTVRRLSRAVGKSPDPNIVWDCLAKVEDSREEWEKRSSFNKWLERHVLPKAPTPEDAKNLLTFCREEMIFAEEEEEEEQEEEEEEGGAEEPLNKRQRSSQEGDSIATAIVIE